MSDQPDHPPDDEHGLRPSRTLRQARTSKPNAPSQDGPASKSGRPGCGDRKPRGNSGNKGNNRSGDAQKMRPGDRRRSGQPGKNGGSRGFVKGSGGSKSGDGRPRKRREDPGTGREAGGFRRQNKPEGKGSRSREKRTGNDRTGRPDRRMGGARDDGRRREAPERSRPSRQPEEAHPDPALPMEVTGDELDRDSKAELKTLPRDLATEVARHLVMAGRLLDEDPEEAHRHALAARRRAARVGVVREACGLTAYHAGMWSVALTELRTARRLSGHRAHLAVIADAERGLGRPERALDLARSEEARRLSDGEAIEMRIVESGARRDLGQYDAAILALQVPELREQRLRPWSARLFYAYADALAEAGRREEASQWFARAAAADRAGETDAAERYAELEGLEIIDTEEE